jgi:hypothetical protein
MSLRSVPSLAAWVVVAAVLTSPTFAAQQPGSIDGLVAWYRADLLGRSLSDGEPVRKWEDHSGNGHDLVDDENGQPALFVAGQVNRHPAVQVRKANTHAVSDPFVLAEHTVFVVYRCGGNERALFSNAAQNAGVLLRVGGERHHYQDGRPDRIAAFNEPTALGDGWSVTVLGRSGSGMRGFVNGKDVSTNASFAGPVRVERFFHLKQTQFASSDGNGLWIAEMLFYDRWLEDPEREALTAYLADKYAIAAEGRIPREELPSTAATTESPGARPAGGVAVLSSKGGLNVNDAGVFVPWDLQDELGGPFAHDARKEKTRLTCTRDGTLVRLYVSLPLTAEVADANVRAMFLVNGARYLRGSGYSGGLGKAGDAFKGTVRAEVVTRLDAGDYVEVVTFGEGAAGAVMLDPETAVLVAEER